MTASEEGATPPIVCGITARVNKLRTCSAFGCSSHFWHANSELVLFVLLMVDRAIAIGYTPISATRRRHFPTTRDGLDANSH